MTTRALEDSEIKAIDENLNDEKCGAEELKPLEPLYGEREILNQKYEIQDELDEKGEKKNKHILFHNINPEWYVYQPVEPDDVMLFERIGEGIPEDFCKAANEIPYLPEIVDSFSEGGREYIVSPLFEIKPLVQKKGKPLYDSYLFKVLYQLSDALIMFKERNVSLKRIDLVDIIVDEDFNIKFFVFPQEADKEEKVNLLEKFSKLAFDILTKVFGGTITRKIETTTERQVSDLPVSEELKEIIEGLVSGKVKDIETVREKFKSYISWEREPINIGYGSDIGRVRDLDEDAVLVMEKKLIFESKPVDYKLFAIADGMGGPEGGEIASKLTIETLVKSIQERFENSYVEEPAGMCDNVKMKECLLQVIDDVNEAVYEFTMGEKYKSAKAKPGSTLVFTLVLDNTAYIGNVGDSRAYLYRDKALHRLTKDHSYVQRLIDKGEITEEEAFRHEDSSLILSNIGLKKLSMRDIFIRFLKKGDILLLCCDGLTDMLRETEIEEIIKKNIEEGKDSQTLCDTLIKRANEEGGDDNISVIVAGF